MSEQRLTRAKVFDDGKLYIEQDDGSWREAESHTDLAALRALSEDEIERQAREDGIDDFPDRVRIVYPADEERKAAVGDE